MKLKGFQGTSLIDYPGKVAAVLFYGGCNLRCPYCHNGQLVESDLVPDLDTEKVIEKLAQRTHFIDGVVITGGEPTLDYKLHKLIARIKEMGLSVKLDSNGLKPWVLIGLIEDKMIDTLAMDLKTSPERYNELFPQKAVTQEMALSRITASARIALKHTDTEFRTTCVPGLIDEDDIHKIGQLIEGAETWTLQQYRPQETLHSDWQQIEPYPVETLNRFAEIARQYVKNVTVKGLG